MRNRELGITLMELMIVVVVIGILAAVAYPNYGAFVDRAKRNEAKAALLKVATSQEKLYLQSNEFTEDMTQLGFPTSPYTTDSGAYVVTVAAPTPNSNFSATATYQLSGDERNKCLTLTINGSGDRTSGPDTDCWTRTR